MKKILTRSIHFYQKNISPNTPPSCRYHPTCSTYALQAIEKHGAVKGSIMSTARIIRCNPFVEGGVDEVPDYFTLFRNPDNIDDQYIPGHLMPVDREAIEQTKALLVEHENELIVYDSLPNSLHVLENLVDIRPLSREEIEDEFSSDEIELLIDIDIFRDFNTEEFTYYTLQQTEKNQRYLNEAENFDPEIEFGEEYPIVVLEKTGIWYTNMPKLAQHFLIERGVTPADIENTSYHLWLVLSAMDQQ